MNRIQKTTKTRLNKMSMNMVSFETDYNNGAVPEILNRLVSTNDDKTTGYGFDEYCVSAKAKIREAC